MKFENCLEKTLSGNYLKPPSKNLIGRYFSKGLSPDGKSVINTKGDNAPVVRRHCAKGDGFNGSYISYPVSVAQSALPSAGLTYFDLEITVGVDVPATGMFAGMFSVFTGSNRHIYIYQNANNTEFKMLTRNSTNTGNVVSGAIGGLSSPPSAGDVLNFVFESGSPNSTIKLYLNGVLKDTANITIDKIYNPEYATNTLGILGYTANNTIMAMARVRFTNSSGLVFDSNYERNTYDLISGTAGTIAGTVDLESTYENADGVYSYNLNNGFDRYTDDATGLITRDVPYIDGVPVVSSITGYTKQSSHPAGQNNMAWGFVKIDLDIMDKSNATYWKDSVRALDSYDSENPKFHLISELTKDFFDTHLEDDFKKIVFVCNNSVKSQNLLIYSENQEGIALQRIEKWIETIGDRGL